MTVFSYQLYSSRNFAPIAETLQMISEAGYRQVEGYGAILQDKETIGEAARTLRQTGLQMPTAHVDLQSLEDNPALVSHAVEELGLQAVFVPFLAPEARPETADGWRELGAHVERITAFLQARNVKVGWHNHDMEFLPFYNGVFPIEALLEGGPSLCAELDLAWVNKAGQDPADWIGRLGSRLLSVHLKDIAPAGEKLDEDGWADLGSGILPWPQILNALRKTDCRYFVIEHDNPADDARFARRSIDYAKTLWGEEG